jgi:hypothetical protein
MPRFFGTSLSITEQWRESREIFNYLLICNQETLLLYLANAPAKIMPKIKSNKQKKIVVISRSMNIIEVGTN